MSGIMVREDGNTIERNKIAGTRDYGIGLLSADNIATKNSVRLAGEDGVRVQNGTGNRLESCSISGSTNDGIRVIGGGNSFIRNKISGSGGFDVRDSEPAGGNTWEGNRYQTSSFGTR
jgi:parallel beta-helix repeat protein